MAITRESLARTLQSTPISVYATMVAVVAAFIFAGLGLKARRAAAPFGKQLVELQGTMRTLEDFRRGFRPPNPEEQLLWNASSEALALGIRHQQRFSLGQTVTSQAEALGLRDVRVRFAAADSGLSAQPRVGASGAPVPVAAYAMSVEFSGGFENALTFVNSLPVTVVVERFRVSKVPGGPHFSLTLSVYETVDVKQPS